MEYNLRPSERASLELRGLYEKYGYKKYMMGKFEEYSLYVNNSDFLTGDRVLTFTDLDGRLLALKPDVTLSVINNTAVNNQKTEKLYYIESVYRENRESHSFKEIRQMGLEFLGKVTDASVLEVIMLAAETLDEIDEDNLLELNNMNYVVNLMASLDINEKRYYKILNGIRQKNITGIREDAKKAGLSEEMTDILCKIPFLYGPMDETLAKARELAVNDDMMDDVDKLQGYCDALKALGYGKNLQLDFSMVSDIDYYNDITMRGYVRSLPGSVLAGGQYDKAMQVLGKKGGAIGFAVYLDELNKGNMAPSKYDVDAVLLYSIGDDIVEVAKAVASIQAEGVSVRAITASEDDIRYKEKYVLRDGQVVKEVASC